MPKVEIEQFSAALDSYTYLVRHRGSNSAAIIDPSFSGPTVDAISPLGWRPVYIINTHHHDDQTGGNRDLKQAFGLRGAAGFRAHGAASLPRRGFAQ